MNPTLRKEVHLLLWPTVLLVAMSLGLAVLDEGFLWRVAVPAPIPQLSDLRWLVWIGGGAFLAARLYGEEFRHRTLMLGLAQPIGRDRIWRAKFLLLIVGVFLLTLCHLFSFNRVLILAGDSPEQFLLGLMLVFSVLCSAPYWALVTRTSIGIGAMVLAAPYALFLLVSLPLAYLVPGASLMDDQFLPWLGLGWMGYGMLTLQAGWRRLRDLQLADGTADLARTTSTTASSRASNQPAWLDSVIRPRPRAALLNLTTKELRLQRINFRIAGVFVAVLALVGVLDFLTGPGWQDTMDVLISIPFFAYLPIITLLTATVPFAEEADLGVRESNLIQPAGRWRPYFARLGVSVGSFLLLGILLPLLLVQIYAMANPAISDLTRSYTILYRDLDTFVLPTMVAGFFASFWIASLVPSVARTGLLTAAFLPVCLYLITGFSQLLFRLETQVIANPAIFRFFDDLTEWLLRPIYNLIYDRRIDVSAILLAGVLVASLVLLAATWRNLSRPRLAGRKIAIQIGIVALIAAGVVSLTVATFDIPGRLDSLRYRETLRSRAQLQSAIRGFVESRESAGETDPFADFSWDDLVASGLLDPSLIEINRSVNPEISAERLGTRFGDQFMRVTFSPPLLPGSPLISPDRSPEDYYLRNIMIRNATVQVFLAPPTNATPAAGN